METWKPDSREAFTKSASGLDSVLLPSRLRGTKNSFWTMLYAKKGHVYAYGMVLCLTSAAIKDLTNIRLPPSFLSPQSGVQRLKSKGVYIAAFPLHEGEYDYGNDLENNKMMNERRVREGGREGQAFWGW